MYASPAHRKTTLTEEVIDNPTVGPSTVFIEYGEWGIPMEQCNSGVNAIFMHSSNHVIVVRNGFFVDWTVAEREESRPRETRTESFNS